MEQYFHGTCESIKGKLRGGGYDKIFWTADCPSVAQNYIPISGITIYFPEIQNWWVGRQVSVEGIEKEIAWQMGYDCEVEKKGYQIMSFIWFKKNDKEKKGIDFPKTKLIRFLEDKMGYSLYDGAYKLKAKIVNSRTIILNSEYKMKGNLFILTSKETLNMFNMSKGESDLTDLQYNRLDKFAKLENLGYDGVIIDDFMQSELWGNVGHISYGFFPKAIATKFDYKSICASNYDFPDNLGENTTPEYNEYIKSIK